MKIDNYPASPAHLWQHFYQFTQIPRPSKHEEQIRQYVIGQAEESLCEWRADETGNVVVYVPGSNGRENEPAVIIQNHLDMVTVKTESNAHDFHRDPLRLVIEEGWLKADGTTLGADNGIGCAAALALMTDRSVEHPPLELLFTVDEETGLGGALELDASLLSGTRMLNLDTEDWGELFIGCAGGRVWEMNKDVEWDLVPAGHVAFQLKLDGLAGGHSGIQIHQQLGNANKLMGQWLSEAQSLGVRLSSFSGGVAHNVIPRQAHITFSCPEASVVALKALNKQLLARWGSYLPAEDSKLCLVLSDAVVDQVMNESAQQSLVALLGLFPHGALAYNLKQPADLVDLSANLAVVRLDRALYLESSIRFFNEEEAHAVVYTLSSLAQAFQLSLNEVSGYPGWKPVFDSPLLALAKSCYQRRYGQEPKVKAIHAGLECGILKRKLPEVDIISFGPNIRGAHSPSERVEIESVTAFWELLTVLLSEL